MSKTIEIPEELYKMLESEARRLKISVGQAFEKWVQEQMELEKKNPRPRKGTAQTDAQPAEAPGSPA